MKRVLLLISIATTLLVACEGVIIGNDSIVDNTTSEPSLELTSSDTITVANGCVMGFINYELVNPQEGLAVYATSNVEWITANTDVLGKVSFKVEANELFYEREGIITISYHESSVDVTIIQPAATRPEEIHVVAPYVLGHYFGDYAKYNYNYYLVFSESDYDVNGSFYAKGYKYFVDIYSDQHPEDYSNIRVPNGVYIFNPDNDGRAGTFLQSYSVFKVFDVNGFQTEEKSYSEGVLTVTDDMLKLEVIFENEINITVVTFEGDHRLLDMRSMSGGIY